MKKQQVIQSCSKALGTGLGRAPFAREDQASSSNPGFLTGSNSKERTPMKKHISKRRVVLSAIIALTLAIASGVAYAYFTSAGEGTGTAAVGNPTTVQLVGTVTGTLYPAGDPASVSVVVTNAGQGSQYVNDVQLASITPDALHATCVVTVPTAFAMADILVAQTLAKGASTTVTGSLQMKDTDVDQNNCKGASLTLNLTSN
jgi:hypothetical protein